MSNFAPHAYYGKTKIPVLLVEQHIDIWEFAIEKATKIYPPKMRRVKRFDTTIVEEDDHHKNRMILAQVFYKKLMDKM